MGNKIMKKENVFAVIVFVLAVLFLLVTFVKVYAYDPTGTADQTETESVSTDNQSITIDRPVSSRPSVSSNKSGTSYGSIPLKNYVMVTYGMVGEHVKEFQRFLNKYGYGLVVDGIFGIRTQMAWNDYVKLIK